MTRKTIIEAIVLEDLWAAADGRAFLQVAEQLIRCRNQRDFASLPRLGGLQVSDERPLPQDVARFLAPSGGAHDLDFSSAPGLLEFLADRGRVLAQLAGHRQIKPSYGDLLCFFSSKGSVPFTWYA